MSTMYDCAGRRIRVGDRVRIVNSSNNNLGTVDGIYVKSVQVRWDKRRAQATKPFTRVHPDLLEVVRAKAVKEASGE
jgi:hypothetical protein